MDRATAPVVAVALLLAVTVVAASGVGTVAVALSAPSEPVTAAVALSADASADRIVLTHRGGDSLDVADLSVHVTVDGDALARQPPVPFFAAEGFRSGPTGPFNSATDARWQAGEDAGVRLAATNEPTLDAGDRVTVTVRRDETLVARAQTRAQ